MRSFFTRIAVTAASSLTALPLCLPPAYSHAAAATTIGIGIAQATSTVDNISAHAAGEANYVMLGAAARLRMLIETLRNSAQNILDKQLKDLNASQLRMLEDIQLGVADLQKAADQPVEQGRRLMQEIRRLTNDLGLDTDEPVLLDSSPSVLVPGGPDEINFTLHGLKLADANPRLFFGHVEAARIDLKEQQAIFTVPPSIFRSLDEKLITYSGQLLLTAHDCRWKIQCKPALREYTVGVVVLPTRLAMVKIAFDRKSSQRSYDHDPEADRVGDSTGNDKLYGRIFEYSTDDLTVMTCTHESQSPHAPGYFIDTETLTAHIRHCSATNRASLLDVSASGFAVELCAQPQISKLAKLTGSVTVQANWKEYRMADVISPRESLAPLALQWGARIEEVLPPDSHAIDVELDYFDGSHTTLTETSRDRYVDLKWNAALRQIVVTPRLSASVADIE